MKPQVKLRCSGSKSTSRRKKKPFDPVIFIRNNRLRRWGWPHLPHYWWKLQTISALGFLKNLITTQTQGFQTCGGSNPQDWGGDAWMSSRHSIVHVVSSLLVTHSIARQEVHVRLFMRSQSWRTLWARSTLWSAVLQRDRQRGFVLSRQSCSRYLSATTLLYCQRAAGTSYQTRCSVWWGVKSKLSFMEH